MWIISSYLNFRICQPQQNSLSRIFLLRFGRKCKRGWRVRKASGKYRNICVSQATQSRLKNSTSGSTSRLRAISTIIPNIWTRIAISRWWVARANNHKTHKTGIILACTSRWECRICQTWTKCPGSRIYLSRTTISTLETTTMLRWRRWPIIAPIRGKIHFLSKIKLKSNTRSPRKCTALETEPPMAMILQPIPKIGYRNKFPKQLTRYFGSVRARVEFHLNNGTFNAMNARRNFICAVCWSLSMLLKGLEFTKSVHNALFETIMPSTRWSEILYKLSGRMTNNSTNKRSQSRARNANRLSRRSILCSWDS